MIPPLTTRALFIMPPIKFTKKEKAMQTFKIIYIEEGEKHALYVDTHNGDYTNALERNNIDKKQILKITEVFGAPLFLRAGA